MSPSKDPTGQSVLQNKRPLQATRPIKSNRTTVPAIKDGIDEVRQLYTVPCNN